MGNTGKHPKQTEIRKGGGKEKSERDENDKNRLIVPGRKERKIKQKSWQIKTSKKGKGEQEV